METQFNSTNIKEIRVELDKVLSDFGNKHGISFKTGRVSYTGETFRVTVSAIRRDAKVTDKSSVRPEALAYQLAFRLVTQRGRMIALGLKVEDLGRAFTLKSVRYTFEGYRPQAPKNNALIKRVSDGKEFVTSIHTVSGMLHLESKATAIAEAVGNASHRV